MLDPRSWLPKAAALQPGRRTRTDHDCGPGRTLLLSRDGEGYRAFCFRCNDSGRAPNPQETLAEKVARLGAMQHADALAPREPAVLPTPRIADPSLWPGPARLWLAKAGLGASEIDRLGAYYHPPTDRVVLPVYEAGKPVFWQARAVNRQPKYLAPQVDRASVVPRWGASPSPTLTEDILSAFKVGQVGEGWALMGTRLSSRVLSMLIERGTGCNIWLDPDGAGKVGTTKVAKALRAAGVPFRIIESDRDPKLLFYDEIKEKLK